MRHLNTPKKKDFADKDMQQYNVALAIFFVSYMGFGEYNTLPAPIHPTPVRLEGPPC